MKKNAQSMRLLLLILAPSILLRALASDILLPCMPKMTEYFCVHAGIAQWVLSIYFIGAGLGQLFIGPMADEYGRRKVLLYSILVIVITTFACTKITYIKWLIILRLLQGIGACGTTVVCMAIIRDISTDQALPKMYSYFNGIVGLAPLFAPLLGGILLMQTDDWRAPFYFITAFSLFALIIDYFFVKETNPDLSRRKDFHDVRILKSYKMLFTNKHFLGYSMFNVMGISSMFLFFSMSSILFMKILGVAPNVFGYYFMLNSAMFLVGTLVSPLVDKRLKMDGTITAGSIMILLGGFIMFLINKATGLTVIGLLIPNAISTMGVGLLIGPGMAGVINKYKHIAGIAAAAFGALFLGGSSLIVAAIMQLEVVDASNLAISLCAMGAVNLLVMTRLRSAQ